MKIVCIGSTIVDVFIKSNQFKIEDGGRISLGSESGKLNVDSFKLKTGGGAGNTAVGFSRLGFDTSVISEVGQDELANFVIEDLEKENVDTRMVIRERKEETGGAVILVAIDGSRAILVHRGAASMLDPADVRLEEINDSDWVHITNLSGRLDTIRHIFGSLKFNNVSNSWNPGISDLELIESGQLSIDEIPCKIMLMNKQEWEHVSSKHEDLRSRVEQIVITDGEKGGQIFLSGGAPITFSAVSAQAVDNTGAGDAFGVGYVSGILQRLSPDEAALRGALNAASVIAHFGAKEGLKKKF